MEALLSPKHRASNESKFPKESPVDHDPEVFEVMASDFQSSFTNNKKKKRPKVVDCDVIEIDEDDGLMIIGDDVNRSNKAWEKVSTSNKGKEKSFSYDHKGKDKVNNLYQNWANQVNESFAQDVMSNIGFDFLNTFNGGLPMNGFNSFPCPDYIAPNLQAPLDGLELKIGLTSPFPLLEQPEPPNKLVNSGSLPIPNHWSSSQCKDKKEEVWLHRPARCKNNPTSTSYETQILQEDQDEILKKYRSFKQFDIVSDYADHFYARQDSKARQPSKNWCKIIQREWEILKMGLPEAIFVRVYEERMDLLRAVIVGATGTPYHDGLFFFDFFFPSSYPSVPPQVHYHSGGLRLNPNLYGCGKVCLSLLNTWHGRQDEIWTPGKSTVQQVLVSVQALVLNAKPFFNEPGYAHMAGGEEGEKQAHAYNENTYILSCKTMLYTLNRPPKHFEEFVAGHFRERARAILVACKAYMDGAQVGCLADGGVQDVDEGDKSSSQNFRVRVGSTAHSLVAAFTKNGSRDCGQFCPQTDEIRNTVADTTHAAYGSWGQNW